MRPYEHAKIAAGEERRQLTLQLRSEGRTFREIAAKLGVSTARASQLYHRALELDRERQRPVAATVTPQTPTDELPISERTVVALQYGNYRILADLLPIGNGYSGCSCCPISIGNAWKKLSLWSQASGDPPWWADPG
ncbi:sigma factor-like helix-turn-helix DNA-binding protein [Novosphingobium sp. BL-8H]|uniref:sigma factor-like helix-turn-helix DNA-binding protein n=1 Tax=Novosphingobium sp. BL-8H TaxID=3127640 RepID=UPI003757DE90